MESSYKVIVFLVAVVVVVAIGLGVGLSGRSTEEETPWEPLEPYQEALQRIDCYPDPGASQEACEARGCAWSSTEEESAPWCYYPRQVNVPGYTMVAPVTQTNLGFEVVLERRDTPVRYAREVQRLKFEVEHHARNRFHFKLTDMDNERYEVPLIDVDRPDQPPAELDYDFIYDPDPFSLKIRRKSNGAIIFDTSIGPLVYEDQFLQISTKLPSSNVYGFGEHSHRRFRHDLNWKTWGIFTRDIGVGGDDNLYGAHPFHMVVEEDGSTHGVFFLNSNAMEVHLQPTPALTYRTIGGVLDFYVFLGPTPENVISQYGEVIGRPVMVPYWSLGFQLCRWDYGSLDRVKTVWSEMVEAQIPYDIQYGDIDYMEDKKDFTYDKDGAYAGLPEFVQQVHDHGQRYIIILDHIIKKEVGYHAYDRGVDPNANVFVLNPNRSSPIVGNVWPGDSVYPDFFNENTQQYWTDLTAEFHEEIEFDALWIDMNEPSNFFRGSIDGCDNNRWNYPPYIPKLTIEEGQIFTKTICMDARHGNGDDHYNLHSLYGHSMSIGTYEALKTVFPEKRSLVFSRSTFAGTGKTSQHWLGDNQSVWGHLHWGITGMLEFNMFGMPYIGADICGFWGNTTYEMCWRWTQLGAFYPYARNHNAQGWHPQHPPVFGEEFVNMTKGILGERYRLLPFLYTLFYQAHIDSSTVVRALVNEFPADPMAWDIDRQFLWGPSFMISAVLEEGVTEIEAYFPDARWYDYYTGEEMMNERGQVVTLPAPMETINLHVRGGHILPLQEPANTTVFSRLNPLALLVALDDNMEAYGELFWDDGEERESYEQGSYTLLKFSATKADSTGMLSMTVDVNGYTDPNDLYFHNIKIYGVTDFDLDGDVTIQSNGTNAQTTADYDGETKVLHIRDLELDMMTPFTIQWDLQNTQ